MLMSDSVDVVINFPYSDFIASPQRSPARLSQPRKFRDLEKWLENSERQGIRQESPILRLEKPRTLTMSCHFSGLHRASPRPGILIHKSHHDPSRIISRVLVPKFRGVSWL